MPKVHYSPIGSVLPSYPYSPADAPADSGAGSGVRAAMLNLFARLGVRPVAADADAEHRLLTAIAPQPPAVDPRDRTLRDRAHLAYSTVEGSGDRRLDVALDVYAAEIRTLRNRARNQAEALKAVRLYAPEAWVRRIAAQALAAPDAPPTLPSFLVAPEDDAEPFTAESQLYG